MNLEELVLDVLVLPQFQVKEALRCLLHTILFNRALGPVRPREVDSELFDVSYVRCGVVSVDKRIEEAIEAFSNALQLNTATSRGRIVLSFYEKRTRKSFFGMATSEEKLYWERWVIPVMLARSHKKLSAMDAEETKKGPRAAPQLPPTPGGPMSCLCVCL